MKRELIGALLGLSLCSGALADVAWTNSTLGTVDRIDIHYTSTTNNNATGTSTLFYNGRLERVAFVPSQSAKPLDNYDVTVKDLDGVDILAGLGANLDQDTTNSVAPAIALNDGTITNAAPYSISSQLTFLIDNAGTSKVGIVRLYIRP